MPPFSAVTAMARAIQVMEQQYGVMPSANNLRYARAAYLIRVALRRRIRFNRNRRRINNAFSYILPYREIGDYRNRNDY